MTKISATGVKVDRWVWLFYVLVALAIMAPLLRSGFILTLDMVFTPKIAAPTIMSNNYLWQWLMHLLNLIVPSQIIEKAIMFGIMVASGVGMHRLVATRSQLARAYAGLFYVINPWTYERWLAGHYLLLAGYAVLPFFYRALLDVLQRPNRRSSIVCGLTFGLIAILSLHMAVLAVLVGVITALAFCVKRSHSELVKVSKHLGLVTVGFLVFSAYWLIGLIRGSSAAAQQIANFGLRDLEAFTTAAHPKFGLLVNVISGYGFWLERYHRYIQPNKLLLNFVIGGLAIGGLVVVGAWRLWQDQKRLAISLIITLVMALAMAAGIHAPISGGVVKLMLLHVPGLRGFREPEKFGALVVFAYAILGGYGVDWLASRWRRAVCGLVLLLPLVYVPTMLWGFNRQLRPVQYPASWYQFNDFLHQQPTRQTILFLPWHQYMSYDFEPRIISSPAPRFFDGQVISGDNAEFGDVVRDTTNPVSDAVENALLTHGNGQFAAVLTELNVRYVLLANGYDVGQYGFLADEPGLQLISSESGLRVWENTLMGARP